jgi:uncharacterized membrane protein
MRANHAAEIRSGDSDKSTPRNVAEVERVVSLLGGAYLVLRGMRQGRFLGLGMAALGGGLLFRGATGRCKLYQALGINTVTSKGDAYSGRAFEQVVQIERSPEELYQVWRDLTNYPRFSAVINSVEPLSAGKSHWEMKGPWGLTLAWDAEITHDEPNRVIAWRTVEGSPITHAGSVRFLPSPDARGTQVHWRQSFDPPLGTVGDVAYQLLRWLPSSQAADDLNRFKRWVETGSAAPETGVKDITISRGPTRAV